MQLSRRGAATVGGSGLYNFMQQRAPSAAPTHACLPLSPSPSASARSPTPSLPLFLSPVAHLPPLALVRKTVPRVIDIIVIVIVRKRVGSAAASVSHSRYRCGQLLLTTTPTVLPPWRGRRGRRRRWWYRYRYRENAICMESVRSSLVFRFRSFSSFATTGHPTVFPIFLPPFSSFLSLSLFPSFRFRSCTCMDIHEGGRVLYWIQKPRRLPSFFSIRQELWERNSMERQRKLSLTDDRWMGELS